MRKSTTSVTALHLILEAEQHGPFPECLALLYAEVRDVAVVASVGNFPKSSMGFPASDVRTIAVSGVELEGGVVRNWLQVGPDRESDGMCPDMVTAGDPTLTAMRECGSSARWAGVFGDPAYTLPPNTVQYFDRNYWPHDRSPEIVAPALKVYSTFFVRPDPTIPPGSPPAQQGGVWIGPFVPPRPFWNTCMDANEDFGPVANGYGFCTGTSMSAPIVAGVVGLMRSTNPYLQVGVRDVLIDNGLDDSLFANGYGYSVYRISTTGIREALFKSSAIPSPAVKPMPPKNVNLPIPLDAEIYGSGLPDAREAVRLVLGRVGGVQLLNRVAPAYYMSSGISNDRIAITVPQQHWALSFSGYGNGYGWASGLAPVFTAQLPPIYSEPSHIGHLGGFYVFTTPTPPAGLSGTMVPIFLIDRSTSLGVQDLSWGVGVQDLSFFITNGWEYLGRQGYLYREKSFGEPTCNHNALTMVHRVCKGIQDCTVVLASDVPAMDAAGYSQSTALGCGIKNLHADADWIPDGFESLVNLFPNNVDTDGDGCTDEQEYPTYDLQKTDPLNAGDCS